MGKSIADDILFQIGLGLGIKLGQANPDRDEDALKFQSLQIMKEVYENNEEPDLTNLAEFFMQLRKEL